MKDQNQPKKRKNNKISTQNIPLKELGFKVRQGQDLRTAITIKRRKYRAVKAGPDNSKQCFMGRMTFMFDNYSLSSQQLNNLFNVKIIEKQDWLKVRHIKFQSKQQLVCPICLQKQFKAPQMTSCGHVFCWHCILMHHYKSLKANNCPVCNQFYQINTIVTCQPIYSKGFQQLEMNKIKFILRARLQGDSRIYNPNTLQQDYNFGRIIRATSEKILNIYKQQLQQIQKYLNICDDKQTKNWVAKVVSLSWQKIENIQKSVKQLKIFKNQKAKNQFLQIKLNQQKKDLLIYFYQQKSGRLIFLHPITYQFIKKSNKILPLQIQSKIRNWQQTQYNGELLKKYKSISHVPINQQIDLITIDLETYTEKSILTQYQTQLQLYKQKQKERQQKQQRQATRLNNQYQIQKLYMQNLKKLQQQKFYDIKLPTTINPKQIGNNDYFPSLISIKSQPIPQIKKQNKQQIKQIKQKKCNKNIQDQFPNLLIKHHTQQQTKIQQLQQTIPKIEQIIIKSKKQQQFPDIKNIQKIEKKKQNQSKKGKKKKQKFTNVNDLIFKRDEEDM